MYSFKVKISITDPEGEEVVLEGTLHSKDDQEKIVSPYQDEI